MTALDTIDYEARIEDPTIYSRPWTMRIALRRQPKGTELIEYDCIEESGGDSLSRRREEVTSYPASFLLFSALQGVATRPTCAASGWRQKRRYQPRTRARNYRSARRKDSLPARSARPSEAEFRQSCDSRSQNQMLSAQPRAIYGRSPFRSSKQPRRTCLSGRARLPHHLSRRAAQ